MPADGAAAEEDEEIDDEEEVPETNVQNRVLFVVPTEPLVWQVAAHFAKHILKMGMSPL